MNKLITNNSDAIVTPYKTAAYGGSDADISNALVYSHASGASLDLLTSPGSALSLRGGGLKALVNFKIAEATGLSAVDNFVILLYRRHDNLWTGNETIQDIIYNAIPGVGATVDFCYSISQDAYLSVGVSMGGQGHYRFGMYSDGAVDDFDVEISQIISRLISERV
jgi:hypothetical protein